MKKVISIFLVLVIVISCGTIFPCAFEEEHVVPVRYYYNNSVTESVEMTDSLQVFEDNISDDDMVEVVFEIDYDVIDCNCRAELNTSSTREEVEQIKSRHREEIRNANVIANNKFVSDNDIDTVSADYTIEIAQYSPFVYLRFDDYNSFYEYSDSIVGMCEEENLLGVNVSVQLECTESATISGSSPLYDIDDAIADMNANSQIYDGAGINVGILDVGVLYNTSHPELNDLTIYRAGNNVEHNHATNVARILCGSNGVARNVNAVYSYGTSSATAYVEAMDWFVQNNCEVINCSLGSAEQMLGVYSWVSALIDYHVRFNLITFVNAVANEGTADNHYPASSAMGYNVIAVAAMNVNNEICSFSSYGTPVGTYSRKPTVSAPGATITIDGEELGGGTSYAAPMVSGVVIKLMEEFPYMMAYPEAVIASLCASASCVSGQNNTWDSRAGAGLINYEKAREAADNVMIFINDSTDMWSTDYRTNVTVDAPIGKRIKAAAAWSTNSRTTSSTDDVIINNHTDYELTLFSTDGRTLAANGSLHNIEYINYNNTQYDEVILEIDMFLHGYKKTTYPDVGAYTWVFE